MPVLSMPVRGALGLACLALSTGACRATEAPAFVPVQTEREVAFIATTLEMGDSLAALQKRAGEPVTLAYAALDLDADGQSEIFVRLYAGDACAPDTCVTTLFNMAGGHWLKVLETSEPEVTVAKQAHRGYRDILVGSQPWLWTGKAYAPAR